MRVVLTHGGGRFNYALKLHDQLQYVIYTNNCLETIHITP